MSVFSDLSSGLVSDLPSGHFSRPVILRRQQSS
jgi:hypothetical protein